MYLVKQYSGEGECYSSVYDFYARRALHQLKTRLQAGSCCSRNLQFLVWCWSDRLSVCPSKERWRWWRLTAEARRRSDTLLLGGRTLHPHAPPAPPHQPHRRRAAQPLRLAQVIVGGDELGREQLRRPAGGGQVVVQRLLLLGPHHQRRRRGEIPTAVRRRLRVWGGGEGYPAVWSHPPGDGGHRSAGGRVLQHRWGEEVQVYPSYFSVKRIFRMFMWGDEESPSGDRLIF